MERPFRMPGFPWLAAAYLATSAWIVGYTFASRPTETMLGLLTVGAGFPVYFLVRFFEHRRKRRLRDGSRDFVRRPNGKGD
jgi:hypothetical protein